jgi:tetratricopeptide (TPR) repeat protein
MNQYLVQCDHDVAAALAIDPAFFLPHVLLIGAARTTGDHAICGKIASSALAKAPASELIRAAYMRCLEPRWGGSYEAMDKFADRSIPSKNPKVTVLKWYSDYDRAYTLLTIQDYANAVPRFTRLIAESGDSPKYYVGRGTALYYLGRYRESLADLQRADQLSPQEPSTLTLMAGSLARLSRYSNALAKLEMAAELFPPDNNARALRVWLQDRLTSTPAANGE